eukprot:5439-Chlamydomonas_euryale.AAC.2
MPVLGSLATCRWILVKRVLGSRAVSLHPGHACPCILGFLLLACPLSQPKGSMPSTPESGALCVCWKRGLHPPP